MIKTRMKTMKLYPDAAILPIVRSAFGSFKIFSSQSMKTTMVRMKRKKKVSFEWNLDVWVPIMERFDRVITWPIATMISGKFLDEWDVQDIVTLCLKRNVKMNLSILTQGKTR